MCLHMGNILIVTKVKTRCGRREKRKKRRQQDLNLRAIGGDCTEIFESFHLVNIRKYSGK
jgi:hypothetical protein